MKGGCVYLCAHGAHTCTRTPTRAHGWLAGSRQETYVEGESSPCSNTVSSRSENHPHPVPLGVAMGPQQDVKLT